MKARFLGFKNCLRMMRKHNGQTQEDGFQWLLPHAAEYVRELIEEFGKEEVHGLRCWLIELIGSAKSPDAFAFLAEQLRSPDEGVRFWAMWGLKNLNTKEARTLLWQARSFTLATPEETQAFRSDLDRVLNRQDW
jgi:hypothetical protein